MEASTTLAHSPRWPIALRVRPSKARWCFQAAWGAPTGVESLGIGAPGTSSWSHRTTAHLVGWRRRARARLFLTIGPLSTAPDPAVGTSRFVLTALHGHAKSRRGAG